MNEVWRVRRAAESHGGRRLWALSLALACLGGLVLLYVPGPDYYSPRLVRAAWASGHLFLFALLGLASARFLEPRWRGGGLSIFVILAIALILLGGITELLQGLTSYRDPSTRDWWVDGWGALMGLALSGALRKRFARPWRRALPLIFLPGACLCLLPLTIAAVDDHVAALQFPVLSSMENPLELTRWSGDAPYRRNHHRAWRGCCSLAVDLQPGGFSGVTERHFPGDWRGYRLLHLNIHADHPLHITIRVNDHTHELGPQRYSDRFNRRLSLKPGWNAINIPLKAIARAPAGRTMDMERLTDIGLFAHDLAQSQQIEIDNMRLLP